MILGTVIGIFGLADIVYLYKNIRKFYQLNSLIKKLSESSYLNVSDVIKLFDNKPIGHVIPNVIVKGVLKAKKTNADKNILSVIVSTPISQADKLKQYMYERVPYRQILQRALWKRPQQACNISFALQDLKYKTASIMVQSCKNTDVSGILTEVKSFQTIFDVAKNKFKHLVTASVNSVLFLSPFKLANHIGEKITYYGIMDGQFGYVFGQAKKRVNGEIFIENPKYITKQILFIFNRLKQNHNLYKYMLILFVLAQLVLLYYIIRWFYEKYLSKRVNSIRQEQVNEQNIPFHHLCIVCYSSARTVIFKPCKHYGVCFNCYKRIPQKKCPICKQPISGIIRVIKK